MRPSEYVIQLAVSASASYRFHQGIELNGDDYLKVYIVDSPKDVRSEHVKFEMDADLWIRD